MRSLVRRPFLPVLMTVIASVVVFAGPAQAAGAEASAVTRASAVTTAALAQDCEVTPVGGPVNIRSGPGTNYGIYYSLQPGEFVESACYAISGGSYSSCGGGSSWINVHLGLTFYGWVARKCVKLYIWAS